jgi:hypothetical protein
MITVVSLNQEMKLHGGWKEHFLLLRNVCKGLSVLLQSPAPCTFHHIINIAQGFKLYRVIQIRLAKILMVIAAII